MPAQFLSQTKSGGPSAQNKCKLAVVTHAVVERTVPAMGMVPKWVTSILLQDIASATKGVLTCVTAVRIILPSAKVG